MSKWKVSKNENWPGTYPWEVDGPDGELRDVFETWAEAIAHTQKASWHEPRLAPQEAEDVRGV